MPILQGNTPIEPGGINLAHYDRLKEPVTGGFDWSDALTQAWADAADQGVNRVFIPNLGVDYKFTTGTTIPIQGELVGIGRPTLDYNLAGNITCIEQLERSRLENFQLKGNGISGTGIATKLNGPYSFQRDLLVDGFGTGWSTINDNTYLSIAENIRWKNCGLIIDAQLASNTNSGERLLFKDCILSNSTVGIKTSGNNTDLYFVGCSMDYNTNLAVFNQGNVHISDGHIETDSTRTPQGYLYQKTNGARVYWNNVASLITGINLIVDRATEGTSGIASYKQSTCFHTKTAGGTQTAQSEVPVFIASGGTTATFDSPFISRTVLATVQQSFHSGAGALAITGPAVSFASNSTLGTITYGTAVPGNNNCVVRFG